VTDHPKIVQWEKLQHLFHVSFNLISCTIYSKINILEMDLNDNCYRVMASDFLT